MIHLCNNFGGGGVGVARSLPVSYLGLYSGHKKPEYRYFS